MVQKYVNLVDIFNSFIYSNGYMIAKIGVGVDTAENEPLKVCR